jgi:hypothetical protein
VLQAVRTSAAQLLRKPAPDAQWVTIGCTEGEIWWGWKRLMCISRQGKQLQTQEEKHEYRTTGAKTRTSLHDSGGLHMPHSHHW